MLIDEFVKWHTPRNVEYLLRARLFDRDILLAKDGLSAPWLLPIETVWEAFNMDIDKVEGGFFLEGYCSLHCWVIDLPDWLPGHLRPQYPIFLEMSVVPQYLSNVYMRDVEDMGSQLLVQMIKSGVHNILSGQLGSNGWGVHREDVGGICDVYELTEPLREG